MALRWYVVHAYSGYENQVKKSLEERIKHSGMAEKFGQVLVPTEEVVEMREGQKRKSDRKFFPGYVLVQMDMDDDTWTVVKNTPGVTGFVGLGSKPTPLHDKEVQTVLRAAGIGPQRSAAMTPIGFTEGQTVKIIDGPFTDFIGVIKEINQEKRKAKVLVFIFGRDTAIEVDLIQLEEA